MTSASRVERENGTYKISYDRRENVTAGFTERKGVASADVIGEDKLTVKDPHALRKENKDALKYALYQLLVKLTGRTLPWEILQESGRQSWQWE